MKIVLKSLRLTNFKGIRSLEVKFGHVTNIYGQNATGKSSLMDAFLWLFFGKDSSDRKDFQIKTLDENNQPYRRLDHEVAATMLIDGEELSIRRTFKEKWVKKRGQKETEFSGHEIDFFWNDVPVKEGDYQKKLAEIIDEKLFKLLTNTSYFNGLPWQERRQVLMNIAGNISHVEVLDKIATLQNKVEINALTSALNQKKSIEEFRDQIRAQKKRIKDEMESIPARIDEANRSLPDEYNYRQLELHVQELNDYYTRQITSTADELRQVDEKLMDKSVAEKSRQEALAAKVREVGDMRRRLMEIENEEKSTVKSKKADRERAIVDKKHSIASKQDEKNRLSTSYLADEKRRNGLVLVADELRKKWESINAEQLKFNENDFCCPACKRAFEAADIEAKKNDLIANFNKDKSRRLADVTTRGTQTAEDIKVVTVALGNIKANGESLALQIEQLQKDLAILDEENQRLCESESAQVEEAIHTNTEYMGLQEMITLREEEINAPVSTDNNNELRDRKIKLQQLIESYRKEQLEKTQELKDQLSTREQREKILTRITQLKNQESKLAQELADQDAIEFAIENFTRAQMDMLEERINGRFEFVRFKMFNEQINGGYKETCECLVKGVPYPDVNTAGRIQAGLDIINTLSKHYNVIGPVWVDNRESVLNLQDTQSQLINLIVSADHKKLTIAEPEGAMELA